jgi:hypothetical protein
MYTDEQREQLAQLNERVALRANEIGILGAPLSDRLAIMMFSYIIKEELPEGWSVGEVSYDQTNASLNYEVRPPLSLIMVIVTEFEEE